MYYSDGWKQLAPLCRKGERCEWEGDPKPLEEYVVYENYDGTKWRYWKEMMKNIEKVIGDANHTLGFDYDSMAKYLAFWHFSNNNMMNKGGANFRIFMDDDVEIQFHNTTDPLNLGQAPSDFTFLDLTSTYCRCNLPRGFGFWNHNPN